jgi:choline kinase
VSGALTNSVFFVFSSIPCAPTLLLRIYGSSSESLISRLRELHTLHLLSSQYHIGPKVYGTFSNGRIEEYFDSVTLTPSDLRDKKISRWIGARMAELHSVDLELVEPYFSEGKCQGWKIGVEKNVKSWLVPARDVLGLPCISEATREIFDLDGFEQDWVRYMRWVSKMEDIGGASKRVFAHNDTQYGNLLRLKQLPEGTPEHRQVMSAVPLFFAHPSETFVFPHPKNKNKKKKDNRGRFRIRFPEPGSV